MSDERLAAAIAREVRAALHKELVKFNVSLTDYFTELERTILQSIEDVDRKLAYLGLTVPLTREQLKEQRPDYWEAMPESLRGNIQLILLRADPRKKFDD